MLMNLPLYKACRENPPSCANDSHRGLWFERFFSGFNENDNWKISSETAKSGWIQDITRQNQNKCGDTGLLEKHQIRCLSLITALNGTCRIYKTTWHFATGLGLPHPVENGLAWHPTLGVPYLAGSSVKGLVRAWIEVWENDPDKADDWLGKTDQAGKLIFFDAVPIEPVTLVADVMTPHYGKWYEQGGEIENVATEPEKIPADWHDPNPVPFLAVKQGTFLFAIAPRKPEYKNLVVQAFEYLHNALDYLGAGAKTAAGYGRFQRDAGSEQAQQQAVQETQLSPQQIILHKLMDQAEQKKNESVGGAFYTTLSKAIAEATDWSKEDKNALAALAEQLFTKFNWWGSGQKKRDRKEKIAKLRS
jgi:CRISPR-associated protein Cmr6